MVSFDRRMEDKLWYTGQKQTFASYLEARWPDLEWEEDKASFGWGLCTFFILYCFFIPMSLYVTFDFAKIAQMQFIDWVLPRLGGRRLAVRAAAAHRASSTARSDYRWGCRGAGAPGGGEGGRLVQANSTRRRTPRPRRRASAAR